VASEPEQVPAGPETPGPDTPGPETPGLPQRIKTTVATAREKADETYKRVEASRPDHPSVDIAFTTIERDFERGGGLIAGALAYRFFFWLLPFVLVLVGGLGFLSAASSSAPEDLAKQAGFLGLTAKSISDASANAERTRFYALLIGLPALYFASIGFVKALTVAHSLVWGVPRRKVVRKPLAAAAMTGVLVAAMILLAIEQRVRESASGPGFAVVMFFVVVAAGLWLFVSWAMPHADGVTVWHLIPGSLLVAAGIQGVHLVTVYYVARKVSHSSSTYGALGGATAILLSLFLIARVIVFGASLNAEIWRRRQARVESVAAEARASKDGSPGGIEDVPVTQEIEHSVPPPPPP
jgi:membrane protein